MKKPYLLLTALLALVLLGCQVLAPSGNTGGGDDDDGSISLKVIPDKIFIGESVDLEATVKDADGDPVSGKPVDFEVDSNDHGDDDTNSEGKAYRSWTAGAGDEGSHTARASVSGDYNPDSDTDSFTVIGDDIMLSIKQDGEDVDVVPAGETVQLHARLQSGNNDESISFDGEYWDEDEEEWLDLGSPWPKSDTTGDDPGEDDGEAIVDATLGARKYRFTAEWEEESDTDEVTGVGVERVIVAESDPEDEGPAYVVVDENITLEAIPTPDDVEFPTGSPTWEITDKPEGSQVSDPSGGSATAAFTPDEPGEYVIEAACGDSSMAFTVVGFTVDEIVLHGRREAAPTVRDEGEDRFWFKAGEQVQFRAAITPNTGAVRFALRDRFKWSLDPVAGVTGSHWNPHPAWDALHAKEVGTPTDHIRFSLTALPSNNEGFGEKELTLEVVDSDIEETATARLFFERTGNHHPDPGHDDTANWYYYWSQEGAGEGQPVCMFSRDDDNDGPGENYAKYWDNDDDFGKYEDDEGDHGIIYISDKAADPDGWERTFPEKEDPHRTRHHPLCSRIGYVLTSKWTMPPIS